MDQTRRERGDGGHGSSEDTKAIGDRTVGQALHAAHRPAGPIAGFVMGLIRRSREEGHSRKFLAVVDDTPECDRAVYFAARRASLTGGSLTLLYIIPREDFPHWLGVEAVMRAEAEEEARKRLYHFVDRAREIAGLDAEIVIREGNRTEEISALVEEDEDIAILVLAAGTSSDGSGPLVTHLASRAGTFPIPLTIVPGQLDDEAIDALA